MASTDFDKLQILLSVKDKDFAKAIDRNNKLIAKFSKQSQKNLSKTTKSFNSLAVVAKRLGPALTTALSTRAVHQMLTSTMAMAKELENQSQMAGVNVETFQEMSFAANEYGVSQEKLADILKDTNDKLGDFLQTGAGPLADFFEQIAPKIGMTVDQFRKLSSKDALIAYVEGLEKANLSQAEMTFYMEALASDATLLIPLLRNGGAEFAAMAETARDLGIVLDEDLIGKAAAMDRVWGKLMASMRAKFTSFAGTVLIGLDGIFAVTEQGQLNKLRDELSFLLDERQAILGDISDAQAELSPRPDGSLTDVQRLWSANTRAEIEHDLALIESMDGSIEVVNQSMIDLRQAQDARTRAQEDLNNAVAQGTVGTTAAARALSAYERKMKQYEESIIGLGITVEDFNSIADQFESSMTDTFMSMVDGTKSAKDAFREMASDIIRELYRVLVVQRLVGSFDSGQGILGAIGGSMGIPTLPGKASGGSVQAGQPYMVGEHGREPFIPAQNGRILSTAQAKSAIGGGGSVVEVNIVNENGGTVSAQQSGNSVDVIIKRIVAQDIVQGGPVAQAVKKTFVIRPQLTRRA